MKQETKNCQNCKKDFVIEPEDFSFYEKIKVPPPTFCPECRLIRRMTWRNERALYRQNCKNCGNVIFTNYNPKSNLTVFCNDCFSGDKWDAMDYGKDLDFSKPLLVQFQELLNKVPKNQLFKAGTNDKVDYANFIFNSKDIFLSFSVLDSEKIYYSKAVDQSRECIDCSNTHDCNLSYQIVQGGKNYGSSFLIDSRECVNSQFLYDCAGCTSCFMSNNLRNKSYVFRNKQLSQEEYKQVVGEVNLGKFSEIVNLQNEFEDMKRKALHRYAFMVKTQDCSGDYIEKSKNAKQSFDALEAEDVKYIERVIKVKDSYDVLNAKQSELIYESQAGSFSSRLIAIDFVINGLQDSMYSHWSISCKNLFACVGLRNKQYCILNKQYTKEEYEALVPKIIEHMNDMPYIDKKGRVYKYGEFFPAELSPFCYNETVAQEYFPLTKEEVIKQGYSWKETEERNYQIDFKTEDLPDDIKDVDDTILNKAIECEHQAKCNEQCTEAFKIIEPEFQFYKKMNLPLPRLCPNCRHYQRLKERTPLKLWHRTCMCDKPNHFHGDEHCKVEFETSYAPERPEIVYCEKCYQQEVY